ncbi:hypothetical protein [Amycolatopsis sp. TNS106]|uniref:hypothetical protein n=1 Tax=Amycolatopsis sp. TNS106 TaxID=2861750 RepID=UPI001C57CCF2|nr:hypothetical protein [Amycolatopsis sp. TNS106]
MVTAGTILWIDDERGGSFVEVDSCDSLPQLRRGAELTGAIKLEVNGVEVLGQRLVDNIVMMWSRVGSIVNEYGNGRPARMGLPEQNIYFALEPLARKQILVSCEGGSLGRVAAAAGEEELLFALRFAGNEFYDKMEELNGRFWPADRTLLNLGSDFQ